MNILEYNKTFLRMADVFAQLSKDPATKVGAVVVTPDYRQISCGFNGFPAGVQETPERWERPEKYQWVVHAEVNAILNAPFDTKGCTLFCTLRPCHRCFGQLINAGIEKLVYYHSDRPLERGDIWESCKERMPYIVSYTREDFELVYSKDHKSEYSKNFSLAGKIFPTLVDIAEK
jgi:dCMP deaminase